MATTTLPSSSQPMSVDRSNFFRVSENLDIILSQHSRPDSNGSSAQALKVSNGSAQAIPVIDMCSETRKQVAEALLKACEEYGFFQVVNHGVPLDSIAAMEAEAKKLFALPLWQKERGGPNDPYGYGNRNIGPNGDVGWIEYLLLRCDPQSIQQSFQPISPNNYMHFCATANKYIEAMKRLACDILELLAEGLGLPANAFSNYVMDQKSDSVYRLNHYPPCPDPCGLIGFAEHSDPQILTVLHSNDVEGLQVLVREREWVTVSPDPGSFAINIGDCLQVLTNGRFKSVRHRVVANKMKSRVSMMYFGAPALEAVVTPLSKLAAEQQMHYKPFSWRDYKKSVYSLKLGQTPLDTFRLQ